MEDEQKQQPKNRAEHLKPWQFKPGQSGNPLGRPPGRSLKDRAKAYLAGLTDEEAVAFFEGIDKLDVWQMAEGKADSKTDLTSDGKPIQIVVPGAVAQSFNLNAGANTETRGVHPQQEEVQGSELG